VAATPKPTPSYPILFGPRVRRLGKGTSSAGPKLGVWAWSFVGVVIAITVVVFVVRR
jgi:hypothetical protein